MRHGFTTGSCAAAGAKAATYMLLSGRRKEKISIITPKGIEYIPEIEKIEIFEKRVKCGVKKDGGDDIDATHGTYIMSEVSIEETPASNETKVVIDGGYGVGRVTKPGLDQPVGNAAINSVPRKMILKEILEVCKMFDFKGTLKVIISAPEGEKIAEKTFNPRLGIIGGISILGTSGIVEPMSVQALLDTIEVEIKQKKAQGYDILALAPGNYGLDFMKDKYNFDLDKSVKCSNFIGETIDIAKKVGFDKILLTGHIGKLIKVSGGIMNTHSREADSRMELIEAAAVMETDDITLLRNIMNVVSTEEAVRLLEQANIKEKVMDRIMNKIVYYLNKRQKDDIQIECIMYSNDFGELAKSKHAIDFLNKIKETENIL